MSLRPLRTHGDIELEVATRDMSGPLIPGRGPRRIVPFIFCVPAFVLVSAFVVAFAVTAVQAFWPHFGFRVWDGGDPVWAAGRTLLWIVIAIGVTVLAYLFADWTLGWQRMWPVVLGVLIVPFGVSAPVAGAAFRMLFDPTFEHGLPWNVPVLGSPWGILVLAFAWVWFGFAVALFRAALLSIRNKPVERRLLEKATRRRDRWRLQRDTVGPVVVLVVVTLVVAAIRLFDLVLIAVPGAQQYDTEVAGVYWWRLTTTSGDRSEPAAYILPITLVLVILALVGRGRAGPIRPRPLRPDPRPPRASVKKRFILLGIVLVVLFLIPLVSLVTTALHNPVEAGAVHFWDPRTGLGVGSFEAAANAGLWRSVGTTAFVAVTATILIVGAAVPAAHLLAAQPTRHPGVVRGILVLLTVLAVTPVQMYILPFRDWFADLGWVGWPIPLILVHAVAGLPAAILLLRAAIATTPEERAEDTVLGLIDQGETWRRIWNRAGPALLAVGVVDFVMIWNDFIISYLLGGPGVSPLTLVLWGEARQFTVASGTIAASAVVSALVPVAVLLLGWFWRGIVVRGLTGGILR